MPDSINTDNFSPYTSSVNKNKTPNGTPIVGKDYDPLGKNAFLKILAAELANQDPTQNMDSTQYISQLAQFSSLEQMSNLNTTMANFANQSLLGKGVTLSSLNSKGEYITGIVYSVQDNDGTPTYTVQYEDDGKIKEIKVNKSDIKYVVHAQDETLKPLNSLVTTLTNMYGDNSFLLASSFMDKEVELSEKDENGNNIVGTVTSVYKDNGYVKIEVKVSDGTTKEVTYDKINKVSNNTNK